MRPCPEAFRGCFSVRPFAGALIRLSVVFCWFRVGVQQFHSLSQGISEFTAPTPRAFAPRLPRLPSEDTSAVYGLKSTECSAVAKALSDKLQERSGEVQQNVFGFSELLWMDENLESMKTPLSAAVKQGKRNSRVS